MRTQLPDCLEDWLQHIQTQHWRSIDLTLDRIMEVWQRLGGKRSSIVFTVAGTNGKGSCVAMLESVLRTSGFKTGSYTSPHLVRYNERVCIHGRPIEDELLVRAFRQIEDARGKIPLTYFEFSTLCALLVFQSERVDVSILETGMGGRLDAVNIIENDLALITSIGLDHEQWLGTDREKIGAEKAGIIKTNGRVVCADKNPPISVINAAHKSNALLLQTGQDYTIGENTQNGCASWRTDSTELPENWRNIDHLARPIFGHDQLENLGGTIAALGITQQLTGVSVADLRAGLEKTVLQGRCQVISQKPMIILDVAHNADSADNLSTFLRTKPVTGQTVAVFGVLGDKKLAPIVEKLVAEVDHWICVTLEDERGQTAAELEQKLQAVESGLETTCRGSPVDGLSAAKLMANVTDRIVIFGSFHTVGDIIGDLEREGVMV